MCFTTFLGGGRRRRRIISGDIESYTRSVFTIGGGKHALARETTARHPLFAVVIKGNGASLSERLDEQDGRRDA
jgi:hypothetical protein